MEPTYRIAQRLHERRAAVGLPKYGRHLDANSPGCMLLHALEESADETNYLLAEIQRRKNMLQKLDELIEEMQAEKAPGWAYQLEKLFDLLGGEPALAQYDEILGGGTVANSATVDPRDEALDTVEMALRNIVSGAQNSFFVKDNAQAALDALSRHKDKSTATDPLDEALRVATEALEQALKLDPTCDHTDLVRLGAIWTKCEDCGKEWADDQGGFQPDGPNEIVEKIHTALAAIRAAGGAR